MERKCARLGVNASKNKVMIVEKEGKFNFSVRINGGTLELVSEIVYLGVVR